MGQSYRLINVDRSEVIDPDINSGGGTKLMGSAYFLNDKALVLTALLADSGARSALNARSVVGNLSWSGDRIVHAGDYGDMREWLTESQVEMCDKANQRDAKWYASYGLDEDGKPNVNLHRASNLMHFAHVPSKSITSKMLASGGCLEFTEAVSDRLSEVKQSLFAVNLTTKQYVDLGAFWEDHKAADLVIDPLLLLTANGNQRGGGDYYGLNDDRVGEWAGCNLSVSTNAPDGYEPLIIRFSEDGDPVPFAWERIAVPASMDFKA